MRLRTEYRRAADTVVHRISANSGDERIIAAPLPDSCYVVAETISESESRARQRYARLRGPEPERRHTVQADSDAGGSNERSADLASRSTPFAARRNERTQSVSSIVVAIASGVSRTHRQRLI